MYDPDAGLITRIAQGDQQAFKEIINRYQKRVLATTYRYAEDASTAEDLAQEILVKVWQNAKTFRGRSRFSTWLYRIVVNHCLNHKKKSKRNRTERLDEAVVDPSLTAEEAADRKNRIKQVRDAVATLSGRQRMALILFKFEDYSVKEVAEIMGISFLAAQSLIYRAIDNLRKSLERKLDEGC